MPKIITTLTLVATLSAGAAFAQQATTENAADTATQAAEQAADTATQAAEQAADTAAETVKDATEAAADAATGTTETGATENTSESTEEKPAAATTEAAQTEEGSDATAAEGAKEGAAAEGQATAPKKQEDPTYVKETYGDWELKCFRTEGQEDPCQMFQLLKEDSGNPIAEFSLFRLKNGGKAVAGATIVVPLGTLLTEPLKITVDGGRAKTFSYSFCSMIGCYARIGLTAQDVAAFKNGANAVLEIIPAQAPDQKVDIKASLTGFTAAYENSSVLEN